jgi:hypothetical protein
MLARTIGAVLTPLVLAAAAATIAGCGSGSQHTPKLEDLPLVPGTRVVAQSIKCDKGVDAFCGLQLVVAGPGFRNSNQLLHKEHLHLKALGWTGANAEIGGEWAADSPGHKLHLTFATANTDAQGWELGRIKRTRTIQLALSQQLFARVPSLSMVLEEGPG